MSSEKIQCWGFTHPVQQQGDIGTGLQYCDLWESNQQEFLHCTPVGSKLGSYKPNMAMPDLNKF